LIQWLELLNKFCDLGFGFAYRDLSFSEANHFISLGVFIGGAWRGSFYPSPYQKHKGCNDACHLKTTVFSEVSNDRK
jgi:hypothetical protein